MSSIQQEAAAAVERAKEQPRYVSKRVDVPLPIKQATRIECTDGSASLRLVFARGSVLIPLEAWDDNEYG